MRHPLTLSYLFFFCMLLYSNVFAQSTSFKSMAGLDGTLSRKICFSPDGSKIASIGSNDIIRITDVSTGQTLQEMDSKTPGNSLKAICFSPDGKKIATAGIYTEIKIWDVAKGKLFEKFGSTRYTNDAIQFSPDGRMLVTGSDDNKIRIWNSLTGELMRTLEGHTEDVNAVCFSPDGRRLASASEDKTVRYWDVASGKLLRRIEGQKDNRVKSIVYSPDGTQLAVAVSTLYGNINVWDVKTDQLIAEFEGGSESVCFSPDGNKLAAISFFSPHIKIGSIRSSEWIKTFEDEVDVKDICFAPNGNTLASAGVDKKVVLWDLRYLNSMTFVYNSDTTLPFYEITNKVYLTRMNASKFYYKEEKSSDGKYNLRKITFPFTVTSPIAANKLFWLSIYSTQNSTFDSWGIYDENDRFICKSFKPFKLDRDANLIVQDQRHLTEMIKPGNYKVQINFKNIATFKGFWLGVGYSTVDKLNEFLAPFDQLEK